MTGSILRARFLGGEILEDSPVVGSWLAGLRTEVVYHFYLRPFLLTDMTGSLLALRNTVDV